MTRTAAVILAAGQGRRIGGVSKPLLRRHGRTLAGLALQAAVEAGTEPVLLLGHRSDEVRAALDAEEPGLVRQTRIVELPAGQMADSFRAGVEQAVRLGADQAVLTLVDQPAIGTKALHAVLKAHQPGQITRGSLHGRPTHPVLMELGDAQAAAALAVGDEGARRHLRQNQHRTRLVSLDGMAEDWDIDTPEDAERLSSH
ncbi:nucleotidyltransferase family protein [Nesterenkonia populi]|uniref:nucleotidyltransferase family protein n=1 Tax=Nesterenkonia populi TaxID=1591087 RepID=UPI0011BE04D9|nr:NTP transferase domain-containing protein [Nesterenkonia populi]